MKKFRWMFAVLLWVLCGTSANARAQDNNNRIRDLAWSPDGTRLVVGSSLEFVVYHVTGTQLDEFWRGHGFGPFAWSPDGQWLVTGDSALSPMSDVSEPVIRVWDVEQRTELAAFQANRYSVQTLAFSPDGQWLAAGGGGQYGGDSELRVWNTTTWTEIDFADTERNDSIQAVAFSLDGKLVAYGGMYNHLPVCDAITGELLAPIYPQPESVWAITFSPDSRYLAFLGASVQLWEIRYEPEFHLVLRHRWPWVVHPREWRPERPLTSVAFDPDGNMLFAALEADGSITVRDITSGDVVATLIIDNGPPSAIVFSPDANRLAVADQVGELLIWEFGASGSPE